MKAYKLISDTGMFNIYANEEDALKNKLVDEKVMPDSVFSIIELEAHPCKSSFCNHLIEEKGVYCLWCEDLLYESRLEKESPASYGNGELESDEE